MNTLFTMPFVHVCLWCWAMNRILLTGRCNQGRAGKTANFALFVFPTFTSFAVSKKSHILKFPNKYT